MSLLRIGILGATGMVGQRFVTLLAQHPWFRIEVLGASARSAGKTYEEAVSGRWRMEEPLPECVRHMPVLDAVADAEVIARMVDFVFCAVDMNKNEVRALEERYALLECPVISNNSAHRTTPDVPMVIPEVNPTHCDVIPAQRARLGTRRGLIAVKSNCSIQSYVPPLTPLLPLRPTRVAVSMYQAVSGAGKTLDTWPQMRDNIIPFIGGEEQKSEAEPLKVWGEVRGGVIVPAELPLISAQCIRVPVSDGHMAAVFASFARTAEPEVMKQMMRDYRGEPQQLGLPSAPKQFLHVFDEDDRPQTLPDRMLENGMAVAVGRLRRDSLFDVKFVSLSHNTLRGAAGGGVLLAELLYVKGYLT